MSLSDRIKAEVCLRRLVEAAGVAWDRGKTVPAKGDWWACCPFHGERTPSFHVVEPAGRGGFFVCFGCGARGSAIDWVILREGVDAAEAIRRLARDEGLDREETPEEKRKRERDQAEREAAAEKRRREAARRGLAAARAIWREAQVAAPGDMLHRYLEARGVDLAAIGGVPRSLRLHPSLRCFEERGGEWLSIHAGPAMVAWVGRDEFLGVHRTWITPEGRARLADGSKTPKQWRGATGAMKGAPVPLAERGPRIILGEGLETTLAAFAATRAAGDDRWTAEAALSRDALAQSWTPPAGAAGVMLLGEGSTKDPATAEAKAREARDRLERLGCPAIIRVPLGRWDHDLDYADLAVMARRRAHPPEEAAE